MYEQQLEASFPERGYVTTMNTKKLVAAMLLSLVFLFSLCACGAENEQRDTRPSDGTAERAVSFDGGDGTPEDPYRISTGEQMHELSRLANEGYDSPYQEACYILTANVDLGGEATPWTPIGYGKAGDGFIFSGTFDGNGHTVSNMYLVYGEEDTPEGMNFGLFGEVMGTIENLTLSASTVVGPISGSSNVGGIAGHMSGDGGLYDCHVTADVTITGYYYTGGLVGKWSGARLENCANAAAVIASGRNGTAGGIAGLSAGNISACANTGRIEGGNAAGGLAGITWGHVVGGRNESAVSGEHYAGGIVGNLMQAAGAFPVLDVGISDSVNNGNVEANDTAGGIVGHVSGVGQGLITVKECENAGSIFGGEEAGGIIGSYLGSSVNAVDITSCRNTGEVSCESGAAGGILAFISCRDSDTITLKENRNEAPVTTAGYAGGILGWYQGTLAKDSAQVLIEFVTCENTGKVTGGSWGTGGIVGLFSGKYEPRTKTSLTDCINAGEVTAHIAGARLGGIVGVFEPHYATAKLHNCFNSGKLTPQMATLTVGEARLYKVAAGGMIGYIGSNGMFVDPDDKCGVSGTAAEFERCVNQGPIVTHEDGQEYLIGDIVGCAAAPAIEK